MLECRASGTDLKPVRMKIIIGPVWSLYGSFLNNLCVSKFSHTPKNKNNLLPICKIKSQSYFPTITLG